MKTEPKKRFVLRVGSEMEPIRILEDKLCGRVFDFSYRIAGDDIGVITVENQKLSDQFLNPIKLERRGKGSRQKDYLVFVVEEQDDLLISMSGWKGMVDISLLDEARGIITITNIDGDWYQFRIH